MTMLRAARHQADGQDVSRTVAVAWAPTDQTLSVVALPRSAAYPCGPESVR
jgi:hypothetical protein